MADINAYHGPAEAGFGDYVALLKPRVMSLVVFTAFVGLSTSLAHGMPLGVAYGTWAAAGVALTAIGSRAR